MYKKIVKNKKNEKGGALDRGGGRLERPRAELVFRAYIKESLVQPSATLLSALGLLAAVSSIFMLASPVRVQVET
jgi:hypothetical protein